MFESDILEHQDDRHSTSVLQLPFSYINPFLIRNVDKYTQSILTYPQESLLECIIGEPFSQPFSGLPTETASLDYEVVLADLNGSLMYLLGVSALDNMRERRQTWVVVHQQQFFSLDYAKWSTLPWIYCADDKMYESLARYSYNFYEDGLVPQTTELRFESIWSD